MRLCLWLKGTPFPRKVIFKKSLLSSHRWAEISYSPAGQRLGPSVSATTPAPSTRPGPRRVRCRGRPWGVSDLPDLVTQNTQEHETRDRTHSPRLGRTPRASPWTRLDAVLDGTAAGTSAGSGAGGARRQGTSSWHAGGEDSQVPTLPAAPGVGQVALGAVETQIQGTRQVLIPSPPPPKGRWVCA